MMFRNSLVKSNRRLSPVLASLAILFALGAANESLGDTPPTAKIEIIGLKGDGQRSRTKASGIAPLEIKYSAAKSTDSDGRIKLFKWSFSDGKTKTTTMPECSRTFEKAGLYTASVIVQDNWGNDSKSSSEVSVKVDPSTLVLKHRHLPTNKPDEDIVEFILAGQPEEGATSAEYLWFLRSGGQTTPSPRLKHTFKKGTTETVRLMGKWNYPDRGSVKMRFTTTVELKGPAKAALAVGIGIPGAAKAAPNNTLPLNKPVVFSGAQSSSPYGKIVQYEFDLDGDEEFEVDAGPSRIAPHIYRTIDHPYARVRITDEKENQGIALIDFRLQGLMAVLQAKEKKVAIGRTTPILLDASQSRDLATGKLPAVLQLKASPPSGVRIETTPNPAHWFVLFSNPGTYVVELTVGDGQGNTAKTTTTVEVGGITANIAATPSTGVPTDANPMTVALSAAASKTVNGTITEYAWDTDGDGVFESKTTTPTPPTPLVIKKPGNYLARVRITDEAGETDVDTILIEAKSPAAVVIDPKDLPRINQLQTLIKREYVRRDWWINIAKDPKYARNVVDPVIEKYRRELLQLGGTVP